jgi:hypothetical protein
MKSAKTTTRAPRPAATRLAVEDPQEGELIRAPAYAFRIEADAPRVEIAIDGDDWRPCRRNDGYWWYEWSGYESGRHQAMVRGETRAGREAALRSCRFLVELPSAQGQGRG